MNNKYDEGNTNRKMRVVMAVNNPATMDYRVVKSAEALHVAGYDCHVVGVLRGGYESEELRNGVRYHRVPLTMNFVDLLCGICPRRVLGRGEKNDSFLTRAVQVALKILLSVMGILSFASALIILVLAHVAVFLGVVAILAFALCFVAVIFPFVILYSLMRFCCVWRTHPTPVKVACGDFSAMLVAGMKLLLRYNVANYLNKAFKAANLNRLWRQAENLVWRWSFLVACHMMDVRFLQGRYLNAFYGKLVALKGDVYHSHELWLLEACALASEVTKAKLVYDSHELEVHRNLPWSKRSKKRRAEYEKRYIDSVDKVLTVSQGCADEIKKIYSLEDVGILRNTPLKSAMQMPKVGLRNALGLDSSIPLIVYTGAVTFNRGLEVVIQALKQLPDFVLATVGPCKNLMRHELEDFAEKEGVRDRMLMHDKVSPQELIGFISSADVAVLPIQNVCLSYYHCMPNKLFEAMFAGLPIVASDFPDMGAVVRENGIGLTCDPSDPHALAMALKEAYDKRDTFYTPEKLESLQEEFAFEQESQVLVDLYRELVTPE